MTNDEILQAAKKAGATSPITATYQLQDEQIIRFAEALIAEFAKQNEPVAWMCSDVALIQAGYSKFSNRCEGAWSIPVFTFPPTTEQIAKAEQRVAEACALQVATETRFHWLDAARVAKEIRSGEWRKFVKEV